MKKLLLPALGVLGLSACSVAFVFGVTTKPTVKTEYRIAGSNTYVGCQNATFAVPAGDPNAGRAPRINTQVRVSFTTNADVTSARIRLVGSNGNDNGFEKTYSRGELSGGAGMNYSVKFEAQPAAGQPLPTAIIPVPKDEKVKNVQVDAADLKGSFVAEVRASSGTGTVVTSTKASDPVKVYSNCTVISTTADDI